jgi:transketolase
LSRVIERGVNGVDTIMRMAVLNSVPTAVELLMISGLVAYYFGMYVVMGDGELAEGQLWEAAMAASRYRLDSLTGIVDCNRIQATGATKDIFEIPDIAEKWRAFGWNTLSIDGHDVGAILDALDQAAATKGAPTLIVANTVKGKGVSFAENTATFHNAPLSQQQYDQALLEIAEAGRRLQ